MQTKYFEHLSPGTIKNLEEMSDAVLEVRILQTLFILKMHELRDLIEGGKINGSRN